MENIDEQEIHRPETSLNGLLERESRLIHLFTLGDFTQEMLQTEKREIAAERMVIEEQLAKLRITALPAVDGMDSKAIKSVCQAMGKWLRQTDEQGQTLVLEAMQIEVS